jgi:hypothetical protein
MNFSAPFIQRPIATIQLMVGLLLCGLATYRLLPVAALPNVNYPTILITAQLPGAATNADACMRWLSCDPPNLEEARAAAMRIAKDATRAVEIINRIRLLYKKGTTQRELLDVNDVIREMIVLLLGEVAQHSVSVRTGLATDLPHVMGDRVQLQQVLMNLVSNSIDAKKDVEGRRELGRSRPSVRRGRTKPPAGGISNPAGCDAEAAPPALRTSDQNAGAEDKRASYDHLECRKQYRGIHPAITDEGDDRKLQSNNTGGDCRRRPKVFDEIGQRVAKTTEHRHETADNAAQNRAAPPGERAVVGQGLRKAHRDACADRGGEAHESSVCPLSFVAKAAANSGARVETEPSMRPARPGCTICNRKSRRSD